MELNSMLTLLATLIVGFGAGGGVFFLYRAFSDKAKRDSAEKEAERIINRAKSEASRIERDYHNKARDFEQRARKNVENDIRKQKQKVESAEQQLIEKDKRLDQDYRRRDDKLNERIKQLESREEELKVSEKRTREQELEVNNQVSRFREKLEAVARMTVDQAREELKEALRDEAKKEVEGDIVQIEEAARREADDRARKVLSVAISRYASEVATEKTVTILPLTSDEMKGKIIGREGRNIRALEAACGVDLIVDETPEAVVISSFDPVRRETARLTIQKLMEDGRVHPARIEEVVSKVKSELLGTVKENGEKACVDLGVGGVHPAIINLLGSLKYRQSEMQNIYAHSMEVAYITGLIAAEIGFDVQLAQRAGLLHDIGLAIDHTVEGDHALVGADFAKRHGEKEVVCHAIRAHEGTEEARTVLAHIVQAANNLSKSRPGARRGQVEGYVKRLADLESVANSFDGVNRTFAIQAGKEIRVLVDSGKVTDEQAIMLSRDIAKKIERELNYPGQVKVAVVRETRIVEHAR